MFDSKCVPCYLDNLSHRVMKAKDGEEYKVVDLLFRIEPMTRELAAELEDGIKSTLFRRNDSELNAHIKTVVFTHKPKPQEIEFRPDPTIAKVSLLLNEAGITKLRAYKPKDGNHWVFVFRASVAQLSGDDLLYLQEALYKQHFLSFDNAVAGLFDDTEKAERKARRSAASETTEGAPLH